jgi:hypothetical protein
MSGWSHRSTAELKPCHAKRSMDSQPDNGAAARFGGAPWTVLCFPRYPAQTPGSWCLFRCARTVTMADRSGRKLRSDDQEPRPISPSASQCCTVTRESVAVFGDPHLRPSSLQITDAFTYLPDRLRSRLRVRIQPAPPVSLQFSGFSASLLEKRAFGRNLAAQVHRRTGLVGFKREC